MIEHDAAVHIIGETLRGPVVDLLIPLVPEVAALPRQDALDLILDDVDLLYRCFVAFRTNLEVFRPLLVDAGKLPVEDAETPLFCGRSLEEIEAMVVRTAAKRHLRRRLGNDRRVLRAAARRAQAARDRSDVFARLRALLTGRQPAPVRQKSRADVLYDALSPHLGHDWQLPLVPEYALLPAALVRRLGRRLLDYRVPEDIHRLVLDPERPPPPTSVELMEYLGMGVFGLPPIVPALAAGGQRPGGAMAPAPQAAPVALDRRAPLDRLVTEDGTRLRVDMLASVLMDPKVLGVLPGTAQALKPGAVLAVTGAAIVRELVGQIGLTTEQLAVFLMATHHHLGERRFAIAFGNPGRPDYIERVIARAQSGGITQDSSLADIAAFVAGLFGGR